MQLQNKSEKSVLFIDEYLINGKNKKYFINSLSTSWINFWEFIGQESSYSKDKKNRYLIDILTCCDIEVVKKLNINNCLAEYI